MNEQSYSIIVSIIQSLVIFGSLSLLLGTIAPRAKLTFKRTVKYIFMIACTVLVAYFIFNNIDIKNILILVSIVMPCYLYTEKSILQKIWKYLSAFIVQCTLEIFIRFPAKFLYHDVFDNWTLYQMGASLVVLFINLIVAQVIKEKKVFMYMKEDIPNSSIGEQILLCAIAISAVCSMISAIFMETTILQGRNIFIITIWPYITAIMVVVLLLGMDKKIAYQFCTKINSLLEKQFKDQVSYYQKIEKNNQEIRTMKHDMKNHLICIESLLRNMELDKLENYIKEIREEISKEEYLIHTGNIIVDAILNEKTQKAREKSIEVSCKFKNVEMLNINLVDLCTILGNSIDNAIEACELIKDGKKRIQINLIYQAGYFIYEITNTMQETILDKEHLVTLKQDKKNHGLGINSIKQRVDKYNGDFRIITEDNTFKLIVEFNMNEYKQEPLREYA